MSRMTTDIMGIPEGLYHWIPGELVVVARLSRRPASNQQDGLGEQIRLQLNEFLAQYGIVLETYGTYGRWHHASAQLERHAFIFGLQRRQPFIAAFFHVRHVDQRVSDPAPMALSYLQGHLEELARTGLQIVSSMPNWLVTAAPFFYADGGSATPPCPAPSLDGSLSDDIPIGWHMQLLERNIPLDAKGAQDVVIVVPDTALPVDRIRSAATRPELRRHWLLQRLAKDLRDGSFIVEYNRYTINEDVSTGRNNEHDARYYLMPDHGLTVVGLLRDIAPMARIRLIRVLNDFGGSDLYTLFAALTDLEEELAAGSIRHLVLNLSLTVMPDLLRVPYIWFDHRQWPSTQLIGVARVLTQVEEGIRLLLESLRDYNVLIVAAAGNDSFATQRQGLPVRPPRAPARYECVLSVAAVNSNFMPAKFANAANMLPSMTGVATFGGDGPGVLDKHAQPDAVRGLYISSNFPGGEQNFSGWADWRGSSLAAPIVSGLGAHLLAQGWSPSNIIACLTTGSSSNRGRLLGWPLDVPDLLANVIRVRQHFGS